LGAGRRLDRARALGHAPHALVLVEPDVARVVGQQIEPAELRRAPLRLAEQAPAHAEPLRRGRDDQQLDLRAVADAAALRVLVGKKRLLHRDVDILEEEALLSDEYAQSGGIGNGAEIKLLIVSPAAQGLGVGGRLFGEAKRRAAELGGFYLLTDDSCDVGFYEHKGMRRMAKRASAVEAPACPQTADADDDGDFNLYVYAQGL
ncbi:MAG: hypothetical protein DBX94_05215, partial [Coriobacteriia bacterium]